MKIELSKDEIWTIRWAMSALIENIESDFLNEVADKEFNDLKNIENKLKYFKKCVDKCTALYYIKLNKRETE